MPFQIEPASDPGPEWDSFVEASPDCRLGHASPWARIFQEAYGLRPHLLVARQEAGAPLLGVLPLIEARTLRGRRELVSMPFLDVAGPLAADERVALALRQAAVELCAQIGATALELRGAGGGPVGPGGRVNLTLRLAADADLQWRALGAKVRNQTRKAEREGLRVSEPSERGLRAAFYAPFCVNMRDLGSPVHSERLFAAAERHFGARLRFIVSFDGARPVGGLVAIHFGRTVYVPWASTLRSERSRCPNNQIYWEAMRWAIERGATTFDFGRSPPGSGTHRFKLGWGASEEPLSWHRLGSDGTELGSLALAPSGAMRRLSDLYARLPVRVASVVGPLVRRYITN